MGVNVSEVPQEGADVSSPWSFLCVSDSTTGKGCAAASDYLIRAGLARSEKISFVLGHCTFILRGRITLQEELRQIFLLMLTFKGFFSFVFFIFKFLFLFYFFVIHLRNCLQLLGSRVIILYSGR